MTPGDNHNLRSPRFAGDQVLEACYDNKRYLRKGDRGPAVQKIQQALMDSGFPLPRFGADGIFGDETYSALKNYQRSRGLKPDWIVGSLTMGQLDADFASSPVIQSQWTWLIYMAGDNNLESAGRQDLEEMQQVQKRRTIALYSSTWKSACKR